MSSGVSYTIQAAVMKTKGPVFSSTFSPLSMVIVAIISSFALSEILYFGRLLTCLFHSPQMQNSSESSFRESELEIRVF